MTTLAARVRVRAGACGWMWTCPCCGCHEIGFAHWMIAIESALRHLEDVCLEAQLARVFSAHRA